MSPGCRIAAVLALIAACSAVPPIPAPDPFDGLTWEQQQRFLPPPPVLEGLSEIYVSPTAAFRFFVDRGSIAVAPGGSSVRYTIVARSPGGVLNVSYEGMRCRTYDRRVYALGRADRVWAQSRNVDWAPIDPAQVDRPYGVLAGEVFCAGGVAAQGSDGLVQRLEQHGPRVR